MLHKLVKLVHIDIREELRGEIPYGNTLCARHRLSLSLSLSLSDWRGWIAFNNRPQEPQRVLVFYPLFDNGKKNFVVDTVEEFSARRTLSAKHRAARFEVLT